MTFIYIHILKIKSKSYISISYLAFCFCRQINCKISTELKCQFGSYILVNKHNYSFVQTASLNLQQLTSLYTDLGSLASSHMHIDYLEWAPWKYWLQCICRATKSIVKWCTYQVDLLKSYKEHYPPVTSGDCVDLQSYMKI